MALLDNLKGNDIALLGLLAGAGVMSQSQPGATAGQALGAGVAQGFNGLMQMKQYEAVQQKAALDAQYRAAQIADMERKANQPLMAPPGTELRDPKDPTKVIGQVPFKPAAASPSEIMKLLAERAQLVRAGVSAGDPNLQAIEDRIKYLTTKGAMVNVNMPDATNTKIMDESIKAADNSRTRMDEATAMIELLDSGLDTNALEPYKTKAASFLRGIGVNVKDDLPAAEVFNALSNVSALRLRNPASGLGLTGNTSDRDVSFLKDSVAGLGKTAEANKILLITERAKARRMADLEELKSSWIGEKNTLAGFSKTRQDYINKNSLFTDDEKATIVSLAKSGKNAKPDANNDPLGLRTR